MPQSAQKPRSVWSELLKTVSSPRVSSNAVAPRRQAARRTSRTPSGTCGNGRYARRSAPHAAHSARRRTASAGDNQRHFLTFRTIALRRSARIVAGPTLPASMTSSACELPSGAEHLANRRESQRASRSSARLEHCVAALQRGRALRRTARASRSHRAMASSVNAATAGLLRSARCRTAPDCGEAPGASIALATSQAAARRRLHSSLVVRSATRSCSSQVVDSHSQARHRNIGIA